jgi:mRNA degradation ribonuclease J1/J2
LVKLTFFGGVNEIGGNKILLEDKGTRIFLDFGQSFTFGSDYFEGWLQPRSIKHEIYVIVIYTWGEDQRDKLKQRLRETGFTNIPWRRGCKAFEEQFGP